VAKGKDKNKNPPRFRGGLEGLAQGADQSNWPMSVMANGCIGLLSCGTLFRGGAWFSASDGGVPVCNTNENSVAMTASSNNSFVFMASGFGFYLQPHWHGSAELPPPSWGRMFSSVQDEMAKAVTTANTRV